MIRPITHFLALFACSCAALAERTVVSPPPELVATYKLDPVYEKCVVADGLPIVGSKKVHDVALLEAAWLIDQMLLHKPEIRASMVKQKVRFAVMAHDEFTTTVAEHRTLKPAKYWDRRARGLGASPHRPAVSCGEENLLCLRGDPYGTENILIHEFAHAMHLMGLNQVDPTFDRRLQQSYRDAMKAGLYKNKYAASNHSEYWAEAVQSWFDTNRENDHDHNHVNTREEIKAYDPTVCKLLVEIFGDTPWRYVRPEKREKPEHFASFQLESAPKFEWPEELRHWTQAGLSNPEISPPGLSSVPVTKLAQDAKAPGSTNEGQDHCSLILANATDRELSLAWVDPDGKLHPRGFVRSKFVSMQETYPGHIWLITETDGTPVAYAIAKSGDCRAVIR